MGWAEIWAAYLAYVLWGTPLPYAPPPAPAPVTQEAPVPAWIDGAGNPL